MGAEVGQKIYEPDGTEWEVYLPEAMRPCVVLRRFNGEFNEYKYVPIEEFEVR